MLSFVVRRWAAWAAGLEQREDWQRWRLAPTPLACDGSPDLHFLPPLFRRRCSRLSRLALHVGYAACGSEQVDALPAVFASRYGEMGLTVSLLESLARREPVTAAGFTHSVHNTQVGLFSISARNRRMASALSAGADTFPCAILEALTIIERDGTGAALLVMADEPLPTVLEAFRDKADSAYAVALVVAREGDGTCVGLAPAEPRATASRPTWPHAIEFLRWLLSEESSLTLEGRQRWTWARL